MRIGIMSDSHGDTAAIRRAMAAVIPADRWLHAGNSCIIYRAAANPC